MNFLHYLYIKADTSIRYGNIPRIIISFPVWAVALSLIPLILVWWVQYFLTYVIIYLLVLAVYPPKFVNRKYDEWEKKYGNMTSIWFYLYLVSFILFPVLKVYLWTH